MAQSASLSQSASSSNIESNNENGVLCNCNRTTKIVRVWTKDNPGRRFYGCPDQKPNGWQHLALVEARDIMREQKEEIKNLKEEVRKLSRDTEGVQDPTAVKEELKQTGKNWHLDSWLGYGSSINNLGDQEL
ncbi:unnamed protein product [Arabis nemorensis]|uniref:DUF7900 domain-containing protein n=1 Tax=Arabis nemorensis TaxID=586526 RepID=A0A565APX0_9BRAS|nr:unnamed protein product [Arabis nemorensis]